MQYILSTFRLNEVRAVPALFVFAILLIGTFWFGVVYFGSAPSASYLRVGSAEGLVTEIPTELATGVHNGGATEQVPAVVGRVAPGAMISFNFDNGYESAYLKALPIFDAAGFKTTHYIVTERIGHQGYVNTAQIISMSKRGHEIGSQTRTHPRLTELDSVIARAEIVGSREDIIALGLPVATFAYPYSDFNTSLEHDVQDQGFLGARGAGIMPNDTSSDVYALRGLEVGADTMLAEVKATIDAALREKKWLILVFHRVDEIGAKDGRNVSNAMLKSIVQYVKAKNIPVVTNERALRG